MVRTVVSTWFGTFLLDGTKVARAVPVPDDPEALAERARLRREGRLTPEEETLLSERAGEVWVTRDRRLAERGLRYDPGASAEVEIGTGPPEVSHLRESLLRDAARALAASWDPSIHVEEAVRAAADLDRIRNLLGERLGSWVSRDAPDIDPGDHARAVTTALETARTGPLGPSDPGLLEARRRLAELYQALEGARTELERAVNAAVPRRTPNLVQLLGPELSARLLAQAGGLDRLARLPASTVQVLGAERAFFEHLRGRAPPPRHGLLFLHPAIQSAPRVERGRLARTLAGKVSIAARLDREGTAVNPDLLKAFERRRDALRSRRGAPKRPGRRGRSGPPLHRAPDDG
jgi:nucleolar protein 56